MKNDLCHSTVAGLRTASRGTHTGRESGGTALLGVDPHTCRECVGRSEFAVHHALANHPMLSLEALAKLADALPLSAIERHAAEQPLLVPGGAADLSGRPSDTVRTIDTNGRWMVFWNIEQVGDYRKLLDDVLDEAIPFLPEREGGMGRRECFLFLSAPNSVTPVHFDPENNFLLQIRGTKRVKVGRFPDRAAELRELDRYHDGGHRNLVEIPPCSATFDMRPGDGIYLYPWAPHWVYNGPEVSVSLSITFRTVRSQRAERVHIVNARMRRRGLRPRPAGASDSADWIKSTVLGAARWIRRGGRRERGARDFS